jgi:non-ribosomal peptide synthetase component F
VYQNYFNSDNLDIINEEVEFKNIQKESIEVFEYGNFDFAMQIWFDTKFNFRIKYNQLHFSALSIKTIKKHWVNLLTEIVNKFQLPIIQFDIITQEEKLYLLENLNEARTDYPSDKTIVDLFEEQVEKTPGAIAVKFRATELTYRELNEKSNQLAHYLIKNYNIQPDELVGIELERSEWMIIGILAILKSGGAYVPIDSEYPEQRKTFIKEDANLKVIISEQELNKFKKISEQNKYSSFNLNIKLSPNNLMYVIYTSGSTGIPKGVLIEHLSCVNISSFYFKSKVKCSLTCNYTFDVSVLEIFSSLTSKKIEA